MRFFQFFRSRDRYRNPKQGRRERRRAPLKLEALEDRTLMSVNPIVAENQLPGTPQSVWDVPGAGDPTIQGYSTDISVNQGQTINFKINDTTKAPYHIDIYRVGYYQGLGAHLVTTISSSQTLDVVQPKAAFDPNTALVDAGNWSATASWAVPSNATSGVYFARVTRNDTGGAFMILFVVRADSSHSQVLFQTSDATWEAYNTWGGYNLYQATGSSQGPGFGGAAYEVSYNRPLIDRGTPGGLGDTNNFFYDEFPMVEWMEQNGYDVSYFTDMDADRSGSLILNHQVYVSAGHDEYWSGNQVANVMAARDAGVNLAFFSGNEVFWKTYYAASIDGSNTPERTLVCYKETHANAITDPTNPNVWTGSWMDPRFSPPTDGGQPQNQLTGQLFTVNRGPNDTGTPFTVPYSDSQLRFWRDTSVAALQPGQTATLGDYELGYEWDEDVDNGFRPAGQIDMSLTTESVTQKFIDYGNTTAPGTATNSLTLYRASSGALVFGAGMVQYDWGLGGYHDGPAGTFGLNSTPVVALEQATVNLFADMYVQPGSLQSGLVPAFPSTDVAPPTSTITSPVGGASLLTGNAVTITGTAVDAGGGIVAGVEVSVDGGHTWHPATGTTSWKYTWIPDTPGQVTIMSRATDDSLNTEKPSAGVSVTVSFQATSRTGLVAEYGFNEGSGTTLTDSSGNHNNGTISNGTWATGLYGSALSFNGTNSWVTIASSASLNLTTGMTLEAWVDPHSVSSTSAAIIKERPGDLSYGLYAADAASKPPSTYVDVAGTDSDAITTSNLQTNTWSFLTATYDGSTLRLYVNGALKGSLGVAGSLMTSSGVLRLGGDSIWGEYFNGLMDSVRIYNRALNQAEIRSDMSAQVGGSVETTHPTVALTGPTPGSTVSGVTSLAASASDAVLVTAVQFLLDGTPLGAPVTSAPYTLAWDSRKVANGSHVLTAQAINGAGLLTTSASDTFTVNNAPDTVAPAVRIITPPAATSATGLAVLGAIASDNIAVTGVQFELNGVNIGPLLTSAPYRLAYDFSSTAAGTYNLTAVAQDAAGNQTVSAPVQLTIDHTAPTVLSTTPAAGATGVSTASPFSVAFSKSIQPATLGVTLTDPTGNSIPVTINYDDSTHTATFTHGTIALDPLTTYTATVRGVQDLAGNALAAPYTWSFSTGNAITGATIWPSTTMPTLVSANDSNSVELGLRFTSDVAGYITGVRFYKGSQNTGNHIGQLWSATGTLLASATFTSETTLGWQQVTFSSPVAITANTTYVAAYFAPVGEYAADTGYFATQGVNSGPLHALADGVAGGDGLFAYTPSPAFPNQSASSTNYWVDVVFNSTTQGTTPPSVTAESPLPGATSVAGNTAVTVTFSKSVVASTITFTLQDASGNSVPGVVAYNSSTDTATFTPNAALAATTNYTATVSGVQDLSGNVLPTPFSWAFTTANPSAPPTVTAETPSPGATGVGKSSVITVTFSKQVDDDTIVFVLKDSSGSMVPTTVTYDDESQTATFTPNAALSAGTTYTATVSGATDLSGNVMVAPVSWSFTTAFALIGDTIWGATASPVVASAADTSAVEVGVKFRSDVAGEVTGVRFYKGSLNTGGHVGHLWTDSGTLLGTVTFSGESASGWQQANFSSPILIAANTTYIVSYYAPKGGYSADANSFTTAGTDSPPLHALANGIDGGNGVYAYGTGGGFPGGSFNSTNYWVDVVFIPSPTTPTVITQTPLPGATGVSTGTLTATFSEAVQASTISFTVQDVVGNSVPGTVTYDSTSNTATFTPTAPLLGLTNYTATVSGATDLNGSPMAAPSSWSFTTLGSSLFSATSTPAIASVNDPNSVELGVRFYSDDSGYITGLRFYKGPGNGGTHLAHLWTTDGTLLATATFVDETATGWQQANFSTPVAIAANTLYVASYYAPAGDYAATSGYFATSGVNNGTLHAPTDGANGGNGLYAYGSGGQFPGNSYNSTNYWIDVVFALPTNDATAPTVTSVTPSSGATTALTTAPITVTFSKDVLASTIALAVTDASGNSVVGSLAYNGTTKIATFTPSSPLVQSTTYTVTVSGVQDLSGNALAQPYTWSFTTGQAWTQTTVADFSTGTNNGTEVTNTNGGEVALAPLLEDHFSGTSLNNANWSTASWAPYGGGPTSVTVGSNMLSLAGAEVLSVQQYANTPVEGSINFASAPYQHFGLATDLSSAGGNYWAIFSTGSTSNTLFARVDANGATTDVSLGALPSGFHTYKVQPTSSGFQFYVDGVLQTTIAASFQTSQPMKAALSSFGASALQVASIKFDSYSTTRSGTFTSMVFDAGASVSWGNVSWTANLPADTSILVQVRVGNTSTPDSTWTAWAPVTKNTTLGLTGEYLEYSITLTTTDPSATPSLDDVTFAFSRA